MNDLPAVAKDYIGLLFSLSSFHTLSSLRTFLRTLRGSVTMIKVGMFGSSEHYQKVRSSRVASLKFTGYTSSGGTFVNQESDRQQLIRILQGAYSGELAAGFAYRGHWKSLKDPNERAAIQKIEREEWIHRKRVGEMLASLSSRPGKLREVKLWIIGRTIGAACRVIGWFLPMYFAGRLESGNVVEYQEAAAHAAAIHLPEFEADLLIMADVEKEHEIFFMNIIAGHRLLPLMQAIFKWGYPALEVPEAEPQPASQPTQ